MYTNRIPTQRPSRLNRVAWGIVLLLGLAAVVANFSKDNSSSSSGSSAEPVEYDVAVAAGARFCTQSEFTVTNRLDGSTDRIFNCSFPEGVKCVTWSNGIAKDETASVRLLWEDTLSSGKPDCVT